MLVSNTNVLQSGNAKRSVELRQVISLKFKEIQRTESLTTILNCLFLLCKSYEYT